MLTKKTFYIFSFLSKALFNISILMLDIMLVWQYSSSVLLQNSFTLNAIKLPNTYNALFYISVMALILFYEGFFP